MSKLIFGFLKIFWNPMFCFYYLYPKHSNFIRISIGWLKITIYKPKKKKRYRCKRCGRDKFTKPSPHRCGKNFLKHYGRKKYKEKYDGNIFEEIKDE